MINEMASQINPVTVGILVQNVNTHEPTNHVSNPTAGHGVLFTWFSSTCTGVLDDLEFNN